MKTAFLIVWIIFTILFVCRSFVSPKMNRNIGLTISVLFTLLTTYGLNIFFSINYWISLIIALTSFIILALTGKGLSLKPYKNCSEN